MLELKKLVLEGEAEKTAETVESLLAEGSSPESIMNQALIPAMDEVGDLFQQGKFYLPEMLIAARAMKAGLKVLKPELTSGGGGVSGTVVLGTVRGDMHDIGKNLVGMALEGAGFEVVDLGVDVPPARFVEAVREHVPVVVGMSALLTTTMVNMGDTVEALELAGLRGGVKVMVGGAPVTREFSDEIGADYYGSDSTAGKDYARGLLD